jgi:hypothetical protein
MPRRVGIALATAAFALTAGGVAALSGRDVTVSADVPARPYRALGLVAVTADVRPPGASWTVLHAPRLAAQARERYRGVDALVETRHAPLPNGRGAVTTGLAVAWD